MTEKEFYRLDEIADILNISRRTVYRMIKKKIKAVRVNGQWRIPESEYKKLINPSTPR